jgi:branched-chain amino acid transport system substrate-binding protein
LANPALLTAAGPLAIEGGGVFYTSTAAEPQYYPEAAGFISDFEIRFGETPLLFSAQAYDAAAMCMRAILDASKENGEEVPTREQVATAIRALQDYSGISGTFTFNENGDLDPARYFIIRVATVDPEDWSENTLVTSFDLTPPE